MKLSAASWLWNHYRDYCWRYFIHLKSPACYRCAHISKKRAPRRCTSVTQTHIIQVGVNHVTFFRITKCWNEWVSEWAGIRASERASDLPLPLHCVGCWVCFGSSARRSASAARLKSGPHSVVVVVIISRIYTGAVRSHAMPLSA